MHVLENMGVSVKTNDLFDVTVASWICDENRFKGLKDLSLSILNISQEHFGEVLTTIPKGIKKREGLNSNAKGTYDLTYIANSYKYACDDAYYTWTLYVYFLAEIDKEEMDKIYYRTYPQFIRTLYNMELRGIDVDQDHLKTMGEAMNKKLEHISYELLSLAGVSVDLNSSQQLGQLLFGYKGYKTTYPELLQNSFNLPIQSSTAKGAPQVNNDTLIALSKVSYKMKRKQEGVEFCKTLLEYKKITKLKSAFVDGLLDQLYDDNKAHPSFNTVGTDSGRISCAQPNLMQIPNNDEAEPEFNIRECFIGAYNEERNEREHIISVDYANLEIRVMAHFSKDEGLLTAFEQGKDLHGNTAKLMFRLDCDANEVKKKYPVLRQQGKVIAFMLQYGGGVASLYESLNVDGELDAIYHAVKAGDPEKKYTDFKRCKSGKDVAQRLMDLYFEAFPGIADFMRRQKKRAHRDEFVRTLVGRKRRLPDINGSNFATVAYNERLSLNACIQGSAADIMMNAQNKIEGTTPYYVSQEYCKEHGKDPDSPTLAHQRLQELECKMIVQVHDELLFSCPEENCEEAMGIIRDCMINPFGETVKLNCALEVGMNHSPSYAGGH